MLQETPTVLIADDDEAVLLILRDTLGRVRPACRVEVYRDGEDLWDGLVRDQRKGSRRPALILLDLYMPRRNGHETLEAIRSNPALSGVPVIMLSSSEAPEDAAAAYRLGANHFAIKPSSQKEFRRLVRRLVSRWIS